MFNNSTAKINKIVGRLEGAIDELQLAEQESQISIDKDDAKILKIKEEQAIKMAAVKKSSILRVNLSNLFRSNDDT